MIIKLTNICFLYLHHSFFYFIQDLWDQVLKRKHALDKGDAIMPVHGNELRQCTTPFEVNCIIL